MKIIVTGGLGFLGINLLKLLVKQCDEVICIDHFGSSDSRNVKIARDLGVRVIKHDINKPMNFKGNIDQIYHMASRASPVDYQVYPVETAMTGALGTANMLRLAIEKNARILFTSTSEIYGDPKEFPQKEIYWGNVNPVGVRSCYDESKRFGEALMMAYHRQFGVDIKIVRIFNSYGPGMRIDDGRVISNFINQAIRGKPITVYGKGKQTRSFCYVDDTVRGIYTMMNSESFIGPVNIGNPKEIKVLDLAKMILSISKSKSKIIRKPLPFDDPVKRVPSIETAKQRLNWKPWISLREGLMRTIDFYQKLLIEKS
jgi:UDP-glucuronate decarboxylase